MQQGKLFSNIFHAPHTTPNGEIGLFEKAYANPLLVAALDKEKLKFRSPGAIALSLGLCTFSELCTFYGRVSYLRLCSRISTL